MATRKAQKSASAHKGKKTTKRPSSKKGLLAKIIAGMHRMPDGSMMPDSQMPGGMAGAMMPAPPAAAAPGAAPMPMRSAVPPLSLMRPGQLAPGAPSTKPLMLNKPTGIPGYAKGTVKHEGFAHAAESVAEKEHLPMERANAIIAAGARNASAKAKKRNPRLSRVIGGK